MYITSTVEICIQQLGLVEEIVWLPYDAGLSTATETLVGILKRVIVIPPVYPHFLKFLHVDIQSTGHTLSWPWSRQSNDVMSEIECAQLHSELFRRRHSTRQSHALFALAKHLPFWRPVTLLVCILPIKLFRNKTKRIWQQTERRIVFENCPSFSNGLAQHVQEVDELETPSRSLLLYALEYRMYVVYYHNDTWYREEIDAVCSEYLVLCILYRWNFVWS